MPYSRAKERRLAKLVKWPDVRYNPETGESKLFYSAHEVPFGWLDKPLKKVPANVGTELDRDDLVRQLEERGIEIDHTWCNAHMKRILAGDISPDR